MERILEDIEALELGFESSMAGAKIADLVTLAEGLGITNIPPGMKKTQVMKTLRAHVERESGTTNEQMLDYLQRLHESIRVVMKVTTETKETPELPP